MKLNKKLQGCVYFSLFAKTHNLDANDLAELLTLADRATEASVRESNTGKSAYRERDRFEVMASSCGFGVEWNGLVPTLKKNGHDVYLPSI